MEKTGKKRDGKEKFLKEVNDKIEKLKDKVGGNLQRKLKK